MVRLAAPAQVLAAKAVAAERPVEPGCLADFLVAYHKYSISEVSTMIVFTRGEGGEMPARQENRPGLKAWSIFLAEDFIRC